MKRRSILMMIGLMLLTLTACGDANRRGEAAGRDFLASWGDTAAMRQSVKRFNALRNDSLRWPWQVKAANRAFSAVLMDTGRDSLTQAAYVVVLSPRELAQLKCPVMVDQLMKRVYGTEMSEYLEMIHWLCYAVGQERHVEVFDSTMQAIVDSFSIYEQMCVYAQASKPDALGAALAHDANQPGADMDEISSRITELKEKIYTPEEFNTFEAAYKAALKTKD